MANTIVVCPWGQCIHNSGKAIGEGGLCNRNTITLILKTNADGEENENCDCIHYE